MFSIVFLHLINSRIRSYLFLYWCVYIHVCMCAHVCAWVCRGQKSTLGIFYNHFLLFCFFETTPLIELEVHQCGQWTPESFSCLWLPGAVITGVHRPGSSMWWLAVKLTLSCLCRQRLPEPVPALGLHFSSSDLSLLMGHLVNVYFKDWPAQIHGHHLTVLFYSSSLGFCCCYCSSGTAVLPSSG